jgi:hypothetical protein
MYTLHSWMSELDYTVELEVECSDNDPSDVSFLQATTTIGGHDVVDEYVAWKIYLLVASFGSEMVPLGTTPVSKVESPLPVFAMGTIAMERADHFLVVVEMEVESVLGSFRPREYDALRVVNIPKGGHLNHILDIWGCRTLPMPFLAP